MAGGGRTEKGRLFAISKTGVLQSKGQQFCEKSSGDKKMKKGKTAGRYGKN